ncbi:hypothetical protein JIG36_49965 [Actinoplanes sp. LDG1-06]|uniref:Cyclic nucleotide-binding domain-containing protein n=1 Tax=Paractinoplanes ovalisporus TaxID=2810368 RepID=A0ABS2AV95_9ACTN|nr:hypothetical protein [Actinoplanes ovalisporus]MBM2623643.1 hypothetical protein [Actinoplanes ovalisporus]
MIVTTGDAPAGLTADPGHTRLVRCLARRGMLHSECQAIDHLRLSTGDHLELAEADGHETAWVICRGRAGLTGESDELRAGHVILVPAGDRPALSVLDGPLDLLRIAVVDRETARMLPARRPVA